MAGEAVVGEAVVGEAVVGEAGVADAPVGEAVGGRAVGRSAGEGAEYGDAAAASPERSKAPPAVPSVCGVLSWLMVLTLPQLRVELLSGHCVRSVNSWADPEKPPRNR